MRKILFTLLTILLIPMWFYALYSVLVYRQWGFILLVIVAPITILTEYKSLQANK